jgi:hypothetical protein
MIIQNRTAIRNILSNKRGAETLLNNVLGLIIAAIGIGLLIFGVVKLYQVYSDNEADNARNTLDTLLGKIDALKEGESNEFLIQGFEGAENWYFIGYSEGQEGRPDKCFFDNCLCVCNGKDAKSCQEGGFCRKLDRDISVMTNENFVRPEGVGEDISVREKLDDDIDFLFADCNPTDSVSCDLINTRPNLMEFKIDKGEGSVRIQEIREIETIKKGLYPFFLEPVIDEGVCYENVRTDLIAGGRKTCVKKKEFK